MSDYGKTIVMLAVCAVGALAFGIYYVNAASECDAKGGALVQGLGVRWYECVEPRR